MSPRPRRLVTLPPYCTGEAAVSFAREARRRGAQWLEVRTDLHRDEAIEPKPLAEALPLLVSERDRAPAPSWVRHATWVDRPIESAQVAGAPCVASFHAPAPMTPEQAFRWWERIPLHPGSFIKHIEPLGSAESGARLWETRERLQSLVGAGQVTVLPTGNSAVPFRCLLAPGNAWDYLAADPGWAAAPGQRLLEDAVRELNSVPGRVRLGIMGTHLADSRCPRIHPQPFDRLELPANAPVGEWLQALRPHYRGLAVASPFRKVVAKALGAPVEAVDTLARSTQGWKSAYAEVMGARAVLQRMGPRVLVLGDGGATAALRLAAAELGTHLEVRRRAELDSLALQGEVIWTWPQTVEVPQALRFDRGARVVIVAYGRPARQLEEEVRRRGGLPLRYGARWFVAQARAQRRLWEEAS